MMIPTKAPLDRDAIKRLIIRFIAIKQDALIVRGAIAPDCAIGLQISCCTDDKIESLTIDEDGLGFDSLSRLELAMEISRFFNLHLSGVDDYLLVRRQLADWIEIADAHFRLLTSDPVITFETSGSTGAAKRVEHKISDLIAETRSILDGPLAHSQPTNRIISLVPPQHIYGFLFTCLLPNQLSTHVIDLSQSPPGKAAAIAQENDLVVATPYIWDMIAGSGLQFADGITGLCSTAPTTAKTWSTRHLANVGKLIEIYGATETGGIGYRTDPDSPFCLLSHMDHEKGVIRAKRRPGISLSVQDHLQFVDDRHFNVTGRIDDIVQIAGVNVSPSFVAHTLSQSDIGADVEITFDGARLAAHVTTPNHLHDDDALLNQIRLYATRTLPPAARPATYEMAQT